MNEKQKDLTLQAIRLISQAQGVLDHLAQVDLAYMDGGEHSGIEFPTPLDMVRDAAELCDELIELLDDAQI